MVKARSAQLRIHISAFSYHNSKAVLTQTPRVHLRSRDTGLHTRLKVNEKNPPDNLGSDVSISL